MTTVECIGDLMLKVCSITLLERLALKPKPIDFFCNLR